MTKRKLSELKVLKSKLDRIIENKQLRVLLQANSQFNQYDNVCDQAKEEGFWFCFKSYDDWKEIKDPTFHQLRKNFLKAGSDLQKYITKNSTEFKHDSFPR